MTGKHMATARLAGFLLAALLSALLSACVFETVPVFDPEERTAGGGGVETVGIRGVALNESGRPVAGARVLLRTSGFLADSGIPGLRKPASPVAGETVTDPAGRYAIDSVEPGAYRIEVHGADSLGAVLEAEVVSGAAVQQVRPAVLRARGSLSGRLIQGAAAATGAYVHVFGMQRSAAVDAQGRFAIPDLPEGEYRLLFRRPRAYGYVSTLILEGIGVEAGTPRDLGTVEMPSECPDARCDSLLVEHLLYRNGADTLTADSVALRDAATGRIAELALGGRGITTLPDIQDLAGLKRLELDDNALETLPAGVTRIVSLEYLSLNRNRIRSLPKEIGNLKALTWLHVYDNYLDTLTPFIGGLTALRYLNLGDNLLRSVPAEVGRLVSLNQLFVHRNRLADLPDVLLDLPRMSVFDIHDNRLCALSARWVAFLDAKSRYDWRAYQSCVQQNN